MAYDPYKSLLANAKREHLKRSADLNTHLVGNVFLPAIDSQHKKKPSPTASLKHLKVIEQCIRAENKREERLAKCATIKDRRIMAKKFQAQRERERELIQALMIGDYPERHLEIKLLETEVVAVRTPRQQINQEITGLSAKVPKPDHVFRKADVTGGIPKAKPHAHKKFKLPECNGSPGRKISARAQAAASANLSSPPRKSPTRTREVQTGMGESPTRKKRSPSRSARSESSVRSPIRKAPVNNCNESSISTVEKTEDASPNRRAQSPYISPHRLQSKVPRATPQLSSLPTKPSETENSACSPSFHIEKVPEQHTSTSVVFDGALSFSEAQSLAMGSDASLLKARIDKIFAEIATQTTPRLAENAPKEAIVKKASSRPEIPPMNQPIILGAEASATTPRRPQSSRVMRSTRHAFLESLANEDKILRDRNEAALHNNENARSDTVEAGSDSAHGQESPAQEAPQASDEELAIDLLPDPADDDNGTEAGYSDDDDHVVDPPSDLATDSDDEDLQTDVAEVLFNLIDLVEAAIPEEERQKALPSPRTVSPRPRSSMVRVLSPHEPSSII
ncbi:unnamed protein product [Phytophthora lilii]|uniref:Unnamed protein product n=1 Tax=Phytophthora lilii TaxID=2077276 RepID=A0A9W6U646_9STRA|nr:unnamed protein product [Phytophthora lilii]